MVTLTPEIGLFCCDCVTIEDDEQDLRHNTELGVVDNFEPKKHKNHLILELFKYV